MDDSYKITKGDLCKKCELYNQPTIEYPYPTKECKLVIVGESPGASEVREGIPFIGISGDFLDTLLQSVGLCRSEVYVTNAIKCFPGVGKEKIKFKKPDIDRCKKLHLIHELSLYKNVPVLALGSPATRSVSSFVFPKPKTLKELSGKVVKGEDGRYYGFGKHPAWYMRQYGKEAKGKFVKELKGVLDNLLRSKEDINTKYNDLPFVYHVVSASRATSILRYAPDNEIVVFDIETNGKAFASGKCKITCIGFLFDSDPTNVYTVAPDSSLSEFVHELSRFRLIAHNGKFDTNTLRWVTGIKLKLYADTLLLAYAIDQTRKEYSLESLTYQYNPKCALWESDTKSKKKAAILEGDKLFKYNAIDVFATCKLWEKLNKQLEGKEFLFWEILMPSSHIYADAEFNGAVVDLDRLKDIASICQVCVERTKEWFKSCPDVKRFEEETSSKFNPNSPKHILYVLRDIRKLKYYNARQKKEILIDSTNKKVLNIFKDDPFVSKILYWRAITKLESTYAKRLLTKVVHTEDGLVKGFPSFFLHRTVSGRTASSSLVRDSASPVKRSEDDLSFNFQNFPRLPLFRGIIVPPPGYVILSFDYSTLEMRIIGSIARDPVLADIFISGKDFHTMMASKLFKVPYDKVTKDQRQRAKSCIADNAWVYTNKGWLRPYQLDPKKHKLLGRDGKWHRFIIEPNSNVDIYRVEYQNGIVEEYDYQHKILVWDAAADEEVFRNILDLRIYKDIVMLYPPELGFVLQWTTVKKISYVGKGRSWAIQIIDGPHEYISSGGIVNANCVFGLAYGASPEMLVEVFGISLEEAQHILSSYMGSIPTTRDWIEFTKFEIERTGRVVTPFGRVRTFQDPKSNAAKREGVNTIIQATASDIMLITLRKIKQRLEDLGWWGKEVIFFVSVHDSASFYVKDDPEIIQKCIDIFSYEAILGIRDIPKVDEVLWKVPLLIDFKCGKRWS